VLDRLRGHGRRFEQTAQNRTRQQACHETLARQVSNTTSNQPDGPSASAYRGNGPPHTRLLRLASGLLHEESDEESDEEERGKEIYRGTLSKAIPSLLHRCFAESTSLPCFTVVLSFSALLFACCLSLALHPRRHISLLRSSEFQSPNMSEAQLQKILADNNRLRDDVEFSKNIVKVSEACGVYV
jgi:hypothetical protein